MEDLCVMENLKSALKNSQMLPKSVQRVTRTLTMCVPLPKSSIMQDVLKSNGGQALAGIHMKLSLRGC